MNSSGETGVLNRFLIQPVNWNRLVANVVIAYNSMLLSGLLGRYLATGNEKALGLRRRISPVAWQHLHFLGH